jgi:Icc-related predicted phosphoesterase
MRLVCLSDTHLRTRALQVPPGDVLLHAGDLTGHGEGDEVREALAWLAGLPHPHKVLIAGNHDFLFQREPVEARALLAEHPGLTYLEDSEATVAGVRIWGSPWQPWFYDWAFNAERGEALRRIWAKIPAGLDVLLTHGPPAGILDRTWDGREVGCADLLDAVNRAHPRFHVFGHIHEAYGRLERDGTLFVNASTCDRLYRPVHAPVVVDL